ncbi:MAG: isoleucine--tRNA ligase [Endomicrobium sp.]|jgi:isoleucyl-tRNA synthetase|nr:isoleucine--tRNA ligase [Endomicrobium sp.]
MDKSKEKDYSKTVNLPKTDFQMKANLAQREPAFIEEWEKNKIYSQMCDKNKGKEKFIFHDGPPYANGHIHTGTALNKILKDFVIKYRSMSGNYVPFTPGWDCHGLPIETQALKELKTDKNKVDRLVFRKQAADFAMRFVEIQKAEFKRLGVLADWENPYLTLDPKYEASIIKVFGQLTEKGYIYRKKKPVYWCPSCETALADAEVEYADHASDSIFVKFAIKELPEALKNKGSKLKDYSVLIWTTTPWTLPANVALAFNGEAEYIAAVFEFEGGRKEKIIVAKALAENVKEKINAKNFTKELETKGVDFVNIKCQNPVVDRISEGILADFVSMEDGAGIVHIAPGHGQEDYQAGLEYGLEIISPVNDRGQFTKEVPEFEGQNIFKANPLIIEKLEKEGKLLAKLKIDHSYPHCWRCKKPVIFRATPQWFLDIEREDLRKKLLGCVKDVNWIPRYGENRISGMLESRPDWCLSRQRLWGVPIPVFYCKDCCEPLVDPKIIYKISEIFQEKGSDAWFDMSAEELLEGANAKCPSCSGNNFRKEEDILDVWFDSGVSSEAVLSSGNYKDLEFPADLYLEGSDQHRGWFQTSLIPAVAVKGSAPYNNVLTHGFVVDGQGKKMSKSVGNTIAPEKIISVYGADVLRLWVASSDYKEDIRISDEILKGLSDSYRKIRNTVRFLLGNTGGFDSTKALSFKNMREIDKYALSRLQDLINTAISAYESYEFHKSVSAINNFCVVFLSGFYLDALKDTLYCDATDSKARISAQSAMLEICSVLIRLISPVLSFTAEEAWREIIKLLPQMPKSVFLADFPQTNSKYILEAETLEKWDIMLEVRQAVMIENEKLRQEKIIGSNLEARLNISYGEKYAKAFEDSNLVNLVLGSWDIKLSKAQAENTLIIKTEKSEFEKCHRCWRHIEGIDENGVCRRCSEALK